MLQDETTPKKPAAKTAAKPKKEVSGFVTFVSTGPEIGGIRFGGLTPYRYEGNRLAWSVPADKVAAYERHHWVQTGRIARLKG